MQCEATGQNISGQCCAVHFNSLEPLCIGEQNGVMGSFINQLWLATFNTFPFIQVESCKTLNMEKVLWGKMRTWLILQCCRTALLFCTGFCISSLYGNYRGSYLLCAPTQDWPPKFDTYLKLKYFWFVFVCLNGIWVVIPFYIYWRTYTYISTNIAGKVKTK